MLHPDARQRIFEEYGVESWDELVEQEGSQLHDSIVPVHCTTCGEYVGDGEPDARDWPCENCGGMGEALSEIIVSECL